MARLFDNTQSEYLEIDQAVLTGPPLAMACCFNSNKGNIGQELIVIADKDVINQYHMLGLSVIGDNPVEASTYDGSYYGALSTGYWNVDTWHHAAGIFVTPTDRRAFIDGGNKGTDTHSLSPTGLDRTSIGRAGDSTPSGYMSGMIAEAAVWDLSVWPGATASDKADNFEKILPGLAKGFSPLFFPLGLKAYWPLVRGLNDKVGGYNLTASGTSIVRHCKIILPVVPQLAPVVRVYIEIPPFMHKDLIDPYGAIGAWLWLVEIAVPTQTTQRIARNTEDVIYGGKNFPKGNFDVGRQSLSGDGSVPRIVLRMAQDPDHTLEDIVNATKGGTDGQVKLIRTCEKFLDSPVAELEAEYDILIAGSDVEWVTFSLGIPNPLTQRIPLWSYSSKVCPLATPSLFKGPRCQYDGEDTVCTGLLEDCYAKGNAAHWGAEIGLDPNAVRV